MPIRAGTLARGERVPSVRELARHHSVSLGTVVQAYRMLEDARLIVARPRSGYFVAARPPRPPEPEASNPPPDSMAVDVSSLAARVMQLAHDPGYVSFGAVCPSPDLFAEDRVRRAASRAVQRHRATLTQYIIGSGDESLRRAIARHALRMGCQLDARDVIVTSACVPGEEAMDRGVLLLSLGAPLAFLPVWAVTHRSKVEIQAHGAGFMVRGEF